MSEGLLQHECLWRLNGFWEILKTGDVLNSSHLMEDMFGYRHRMGIKYLSCS